MFKFTVRPDDPALLDFDVEAGMRDLRRWEKTHKGRVFGQIADAKGMSATALFEIAFAACSRQGLIPPGLTEDQFAETHDIDLLEDDEESGETAEDPTRAAA